MHVKVAEKRLTERSAARAALAPFGSHERESGSRREHSGNRDQSLDYEPLPENGLRGGAPDPHGTEHHDGHEKRNAGPPEATGHP